MPEAKAETQKPVPEPKPKAKPNHVSVEAISGLRRVGGKWFVLVRFEDTAYKLIVEDGHEAKKNYLVPKTAFAEVKLGFIKA